MTTGSDGRCCREVSLPALSDDDAVWSFYEGLLISPSLPALVVGSTRSEDGAVSAVDELASHRAQLAERDARLAENDVRLAENVARLAENDARLAEKDAEIAALKAQLPPQVDDLSR